jgi:hypothetical protein
MIVSPLVQQRVGRELTGLATGQTWRFIELADEA